MVMSPSFLSLSILIPFRVRSSAHGFLRVIRHFPVLVWKTFQTEYW